MSLISEKFTITNSRKKLNKECGARPDELMVQDTIEAKFKRRWGETFETDAMPDGAIPCPSVPRAVTGSKEGP